MSRIFIPALLGASLLSAPALPAQFNGNLNPSLTMAGVCTVAGGAIGFGTVTTLSTAINGVGTFTVTCSPSAHYNIGLGTGQNSASVTTRKMKTTSGPALFVDYALYSDAGRTQNWGQSVGADTVNGNGNGSARSYSVYGRIPVQTSPGNGAFADTVQITVTY